jgi:ketosteroid isomerase-like protein
MSQENVEVVRASFEAWNAGDMHAWGALLAPDLTWHPTQDWPEPGPDTGREAVLRQVRQIREAWDADTAEPISEFIHAADGVAVRFVWRARGHGQKRTGRVADPPLVSGARSGRDQPARPVPVRHTFATEALAGRISMFELARVMGISAKMIDRTYGHLARDSEDAIHARLDARADRSGVVVASEGE